MLSDDRSNAAADDGRRRTTDDQYFPAAAAAAAVAAVGFVSGPRDSLAGPAGRPHSAAADQRVGPPWSDDRYRGARVRPASPSVDKEITAIEHRKQQDVDCLGDVQLDIISHVHSTKI